MPSPTLNIWWPSESWQRVPESAHLWQEWAWGTGRGASAQLYWETGLAVLAGRFSFLFFYFKNSSTYACHHSLSPRSSRRSGSLLGGEKYNVFITQLGKLSLREWLWGPTRVMADEAGVVLPECTAYTPKLI